MPIEKARLAQQLSRWPSLMNAARSLRDWRADAQLRGLKSRPGVFINSMPKAGTHLLRGLLAGLQVEYYQRHVTRFDQKRMERLGGALFLTHLSYSESVEHLLYRSGYQQQLLLRSPLDVAVSTIVYVLSRHDHPQHRLYRQARAEGGLEACARLRMLGEGRDGRPHSTFEQMYRRYYDWHGRPGVVSLFYEDYLGEDGLQNFCAMLDSAKIAYRSPPAGATVRSVAPPRDSITAVAWDADREELRALIRTRYWDSYAALDADYQAQRGIPR